jgi:hypothetical protein
MIEPPKGTGSLALGLRSSISVLICALAMLQLPSAHAQTVPFRNLDFEMAQIVPVQSPDPHAIDPLFALPYWSLFSCLSNTCYPSAAVVHNEMGPDGVGVLLRSDYPLQGNYSVVLISTTFILDIQVGLSQTGFIPENTEYITIRKRGFVDGFLSLDGVKIPLFDEGTLLRGDVSAFAGETIELALQGTMFIDDIQFVPSAIPEPGTFTLVGLGCGALLLRNRRNNCRPTPRRF